MISATATPGVQQVVAVISDGNNAYDLLTTIALVVAGILCLFLGALLVWLMPFGSRESG